MVPISCKLAPIAVGGAPICCKVLEQMAPSGAQRSLAGHSRPAREARRRLGHLLEHVEVMISGAREGLDAADPGGAQAELLGCAPRRALLARGRAAAPIHE